MFASAGISFSTSHPCPPRSSTGHHSTGAALAARPRWGGCTQCRTEDAPVRAVTSTGLVSEHLVSSVDTDFTPHSSLKAGSGGGGRGGQGCSLFLGHVEPAGLTCFNTGWPSHCCLVSPHPSLTASYPSCCPSHRGTTVLLGASVLTQRNKTSVIVSLQTLFTFFFLFFFFF